MANWQARVVAGVVGASAGASAYLPTFICSGAPCTSCFACVGAGGAAASALLVGFVSRRLSTRSHREDLCERTIETVQDECQGLQ